MDFQKLLQPVPQRAKFSDPDYFVWGGGMVRDENGLCHLLYSRWPKEKGFGAWVTHSEIAHAVSEDPPGSYEHVDVALEARGKQYWDGLCTHNPTVRKFGDRYCLYYMGNTGDGEDTENLNWVHRNNQRIGIAVADSPAGPWMRFDEPVVDVSEDDDAPDALMVSNPSVARRPDGHYLMVYKAVGKRGELPFGGPVVHCIAVSQKPIAIFEKCDQLAFTKAGERFPAEDPFIWRGEDRYWAIVKDQGGHFTGVQGMSLALFESDDGFDWRPADNPLVSGRKINWANGGVQQVKRLERPQLWLEDRIPKVLFCAVRDESELSYNVAIPIGEEPI